MLHSQLLLLALQLEKRGDYFNQERITRIVFSTHGKICPVYTQYYSWRLLFLLCALASTNILSATSYTLLTNTCNPYWMDLEGGREHGPLSPALSCYYF